MGHPQAFSAAAIQFCLSIKVLLALPLRLIEPSSATGSSEPARGHHVSGRRRVANRRESSPPDCFPGSAHIRKQEAVLRRQWRKIHLGIDADTLEVRAVEMTSNRIGDAPVLPDLLAQISAEERIDNATAPFHPIQVNHFRATDGNL